MGGLSPTGAGKGTDAGRRSPFWLVQARLLLRSDSAEGAHVAELSPAGAGRGSGAGDLKPLWLVRLALRSGSAAGEAAGWLTSALSWLTSALSAFEMSTYRLSCSTSVSIIMISETPTTIMSCA